MGFDVLGRLLLFSHLAPPLCFGTLSATVGELEVSRLCPCCLAALQAFSNAERRSRRVSRRSTCGKDVETRSSPREVVRLGSKPVSVIAVAAAFLLLANSLFSAIPRRVARRPASRPAGCLHSS
jgi:hypothetical protein